MTIFIASDHAGFGYKTAITQHLEANGHLVSDLGCDSEDSVDYPDYAAALVDAMRDAPESRGILVCGSGVGMSIAANRFCHIRAALCTSREIAKLSRQHNDANVCCLGSRLLSQEDAIHIIHEFLTTAFEGGRHEKRVSKLTQMPTTAKG